MNIKNRQEIINLMPWYNLGKLTDAEKLMVDEALNEDSSLAEQLALDKKIMSRVIASPELLNKSAFESTTARLDNVLAQIDETVVKSIAGQKETVVKDDRQTVSLFSGVKSFFTDLLSGSSHSFTYAVFAALTVVQLALLMFFVVPSTMQSSEYDNAFGDGSSRIVEGPSVTSKVDEDNSGLVLVITIEDNILVDGFTSKKFGDLKFELLPDNAGRYRVRLDKNMSPEEIGVLKNELSEKIANIKFVIKEIRSQ